MNCPECRRAMYYEPRLQSRDFKVYSCKGRWAKRHDALLLKVPTKRLDHEPRGTRLLQLDRMKASG